MKSKRKKLLESAVNRRAKLLENHVLGLGQLPSSKLMKMKWNPVTNKSLKEQESPVENDIIGELKDVLVTWETKEYASDEARWKEYYADIQKIVNKYTANESSRLY
tara:strand:+ start:264 stop:581 length:318 start_codon:yes stop_codon:yes gene_type:complete